LDVPAGGVGTLYFGRHFSCRRRLPHTGQTHARQRFVTVAWSSTFVCRGGVPVTAHPSLLFTAAVLLPYADNVCRSAFTNAWSLFLLPCFVIVERNARPRLGVCLTARVWAFIVRGCTFRTIPPRLPFTTFLVGFVAADVGQTFSLPLPFRAFPGVCFAFDILCALRVATFRLPFATFYCFDYAFARTRVCIPRLFAFLAHVCVTIAVYVVRAGLRAHFANAQADCSCSTFGCFAVRFTPVFTLPFVAFAFVD